MKRLEKVDTKTVTDINNGNGREEELTQTIYRNISNSFCIKSIEIVDNNEFMYDDLRNCGNNLDDDVFIEKERGLSIVSDHFALSPAPSSATGESAFTFDKIERRLSFNDDALKGETYYRSESEKSGEEVKKETGSVGRPRRASDVIDSLGEDFGNLKRCLETGGIAINSPRSRTSSDLGYSGSFTSSSPAASFSFPPQVFSLERGGRRVNDATDSKPFTNRHQGSDVVPEAVMPVDRDAEEYNMYHPRRGRAIIINNDTFDNNFASFRKGSHVDVENLKKVFTTLGFDVTVYDNPTYHQIREGFYEISQEDHSDADCLLVAVLTHGMDNGLLYARDALYPVDALWLPFTADKCLTLAGKPKIFFVQACRGEKLDPGVLLVSRKERKESVTETDAGVAAYKLPSHSDFLIAYSSTNGFYSWRNPEEGTWFIQSLAEELRQNGTHLNFLDILTRVNRKVALHFASYNEDMPWLSEQKQVPTFQSTLIRDLIFRPKN